MAKGLPYFKFMPADWLTGNICFESLEAQGLFINVCAWYWQRDGKLTVEDINLRYNKPPALVSLIDRYFSVSDGLISIAFLDEQFIERKHVSKENSKNGKLGGRPKTKATKPNAKRTPTEPKAKKSQLEVELEEKKNNIEERKLKFASTLEPFVLIYGKELIRAFYDYWVEPNKSNTKFRQELEKTWDAERRIKTWAANEKNSIKPKTEKKITY